MVRCSTRKTTLFCRTSGTLRQSGTNTMNLVYSEQSVALSSQNFTKQAEQRVDNHIDVTGAGGASAIVQEGSNLGNIIVARNVDEVIRDFSGDQIINNVVRLEDGARWGSISQNGTNIANYIEPRTSAIWSRPPAMASRL